MMTTQEKNILNLLVLGKSSREIAKKLLISFHTVETHRKHLRTKFGVHSTAELIMKATQKGMVQL